MPSGLSERLIRSHYETDYCGAVRALNVVRAEMERVDLATAPGVLLRALKREEHLAMASIALHELYFGALGGDGRMDADVGQALEAAFGSLDAWRDEFLTSTIALGGAGWVLLSHARGECRLVIQLAADHAQTLVDATPILALDMYEHAYHIDFGADAVAYVEAFMRQVDWRVVAERLAEADGSAVRGCGLARPAA
jgi:Fe-Mn family superoxide dismutase